MNETKKIPFFWISLFILLLGYGFLNLYFYLVPTENMTLYLKKDACFVVETIGQQQNQSCSVKGSVRQDLLTDGYLIKFDDGKEYFLSSDIVVGLMHTSEK